MGEAGPGESLGVKGEDFSKNEFDFGRGLVEVYRSKPDGIVLPLQEESSLPILFAQGYAGDTTLPWYVKAFGKAGNDTFGIAYSGQRKTNNPDLVRKEGLNLPVSELEYEKALDIIDSMDKMGIAQSDIVAESAGALRVLIAAALHPEKFRKIILVHPAGVDDRGSSSTHMRVAHHQIRSIMDPRLLSERLKRKVRRSQIPDAEKAASREGYKYIRAEQESVAYSRLHPLIGELSKQHPHLQFSIIADKNDYNFRWRRLQKVSRGNLFAFIISHWKGHGIGHKQERVNEISNLLRSMKQTDNKAGSLSAHEAVA